MMEDNYEKYAIAVIIVFGAVMIAGLMAANISVGDRNGFAYAMGSGFAAWLAGHAMLFDRPRVYGILILLATAFAVASLVTYLT